jgi:hypothetical protein
MRLMTRPNTTGRGWRRPGPQVRGDGDQVDRHNRHRYYGGHTPGIAFQGERVAVFPGELLVGERRTMSPRGAARWST